MLGRPGMTARDRIFGAVRTMLALVVLVGPVAEVGGFPMPAWQDRAAAATNGRLAVTSTAPWTVQNSGTTAGLRGVTCSGASLCYAVGLTGTIVAAPVSGGSSWTPQT